MEKNNYTFSVFTKPWKEMSLSELGQFVSDLGFDGVELPVRPGFQVEPKNVRDGLMQAVEIFSKYGIEINSVAGPTDEATIAACGEAGVSIIRICVSISEDGYMATEARLQREYDDLVPLLDEQGVTLGIQNHYGPDICNAMGIRHLIESMTPGTSVPFIVSSTFLLSVSYLR